MQLGVQLIFQNHQDYSDREMYKHELRLAIEAEGMGYDVLWPVEHHFFDYSMWLYWDSVGLQYRRNLTPPFFL